MTEVGELLAASCRLRERALRGCELRVAGCGLRVAPPPLVCLPYGKLSPLRSGSRRTLMRIAGGALRAVISALQRFLISPFPLGRLPRAIPSAGVQHFPISLDARPSPLDPLAFCLPHIRQRGSPCSRRSTLASRPLFALRALNRLRIELLDDCRGAFHGGDVARLGLELQHAAEMRKVRDIGELHALERGEFRLIPTGLVGKQPCKIRAAGDDQYGIEGGGPLRHRIGIAIVVALNRRTEELDGAAVEATLLGGDSDLRPVLLLNGETERKRAEGIRHHETVEKIARRLELITGQQEIEEFAGAGLAALCDCRRRDKGRTGIRRGIEQEAEMGEVVVEGRVAGLENPGEGFPRSLGFSVGNLPGGQQTQRRDLVWPGRCGDLFDGGGIQGFALRQRETGSGERQFGRIGSSRFDLGEKVFRDAKLIRGDGGVRGCQQNRGCIPKLDRHLHQFLLGGRRAGIFKDGEDTARLKIRIEGIALCGLAPRDLGLGRTAGFQKGGVTRPRFRTLRRLVENGEVDGSRRRKVTSGRGRLGLRDLTSLRRVVQCRPGQEPGNEHNGTDRGANDRELVEKGPFAEFLLQQSPFSRNPFHRSIRSVKFPNSPQLPREAKGAGNIVK